jgi:hypothetical protein
MAGQAKRAEEDPAFAFFLQPLAFSFHPCLPPAAIGRLSVKNAKLPLAALGCS